MRSEAGEQEVVGGPAQATQMEVQDRGVKEERGLKKIVKILNASIVMLNAFWDELAACSR